MHLKWGQHKPYGLQGAASALPQPVAFHVTSTTRSAWKGRPPSARGRRGKDRLHIRYAGVEKHGFLLFGAWGVLSKSTQVCALLSSFPAEAGVQEQQRGSRGWWAEVCARALRLMNWKRYYRSQYSLMGNLSPHMLHNFHIIEPTRNCLINKASRKPSKSRRVKKHALACQLILCTLKSWTGLSTSCWATSSVSLGGVSVVSWGLTVCVCIHHFHLHASLVTSCMTGAVAWSAWISLIMTTTSFGHISSVQKDWNFFCIGVVSWTSCDCFIGKIKSEGMRHACTLPWEENSFFKYRCTFIDPFLCLSQSMVNTPEF